MAVKTYVKASGTWRPSKEIYVKSGGSWRQIKKAWHKTAGVWELVHDRLVILNLIISSNTFNYNIKSAAETLYGGPITGPAQITLTVNPGVIVGATDTLIPGIDSGTFASGSSLILNNYGYIVGKGGQGGSVLTPAYSSQYPYYGGPALQVTLPTNVYNYGIIGGGGGGGAGGDGVGSNSIGGGGGAGAQGGPGGWGYGGYTSYGASGTLLNGGVGTHDPIYVSTGGNLGYPGIYGGG
ncbi:MAG: hypothetical protein QXG00_07435, partial [Candidatus Woesearchaeota archaeon]